MGRVSRQLAIGPAKSGEHLFRMGCVKKVQVADVGIRHHVHLELLHEPVDCHPEIVTDQQQHLQPVAVCLA